MTFSFAPWKKWSLPGLALVLCLGAASFLPAQDTTPGGYSNLSGPVNGILDIYEQLSGKHLIRDVNLTQIPNISINASGVSKTEMLKLIEDALLLNGVALVPIDSDTIKVVTVTTNKNVRSEGVRLFTNAADLPQDEEVVSYYMPLSYISATEAAAIFTQDAPTHSYGVYVPAPSAQAVIITEETSVIRELIALKELIDVPPARVDTEFITLQRADAEKVADLLTKLLNPQTGGPGQALPTTFVPANVGTTEPLFNEKNLLSGPVQIVADTRSNRLLVITRAVNLPFLKQMIAELDQPNTYSVPVRRDLKYVLAQDILPAIESTLAQGKDEEDQVAKSQSSTNTNLNNQNPANSPQNTNQSNPSSSSGGSPGNVSSVTSPLSAPPQNNVPTIVSVGKTRILADNRSNSIIVFGSPDAVERVNNIIDALDRKPLQVYLATVIGELTVSQGLEFGIDILQKFQHVGTVGAASGLVTPGTNAGGSGLVPEPGALTTASGFPLPTGLTIYGAIGNTLNAYVRALETTNRFKVISRPSVYTTNNKLAVIASGSQVPIPANTTSGFTGSNNQLTTTSSTTYIDVLLQLDIIPLINANHQVTLKIRQTDNSLGASQVISGNSVPTINTQEINTEVTVPDKSTIVIGGLISDTNNRTESGVPFLSDIPVLGYLFKDTTKNKSRNELIIMIQPTVVETDADQVAANEAEKQRTILGQEAEEAARVAPGVTTTTTTTTTSVPNPDATSFEVPAPPRMQPSTVPANSSAAPDVVPAVPTSGTTP
jgi:type II secretion system protein D